jgi:hypothetical protein
MIDITLLLLLFKKFRFALRSLFFLAILTIAVSIIVPMPFRYVCLGILFAGWLALLLTSEYFCYKIMLDLWQKTQEERIAKL